MISFRDLINFTNYAPSKIRYLINNNYIINKTCIKYDPNTNKFKNTDYCYYYICKGLEQHRGQKNLEKTPYIWEHRKQKF